MKWGGGPSSEEMTGILATSIRQVMDLEIYWMWRLKERDVGWLTGFQCVYMRGMFLRGRNQGGSNEGAVLSCLLLVFNWGSTVKSWKWRSQSQVLTTSGNWGYERLVCQSIPNRWWCFSHLAFLPFIAIPEMNKYHFVYPQSQVALAVKNPPTNSGRHKRDGFHPWVGKISWRRKWQPTQYFCLWNLMDRRAEGLQSIGPQRIRHNWVA